MTALSLYHWDYDRRRPSSEPILTFSIAIFQWQPKASGKGLKKINASRVCGFAADAQSMYAKAQEICNRLNTEKASVLARPAWLQKQYSVPRPKWIPPDPPRDHLPASAVRSIRRSTMKHVLIPVGFVAARQATYVRQENDLIQVIYFQGSKWGGSYTINLGLHYDFMKPTYGKKRKPLTQYDHLDCALQVRIGEVLTGRDQWFDYGKCRTMLIKQFEQNAADSLASLAKFTKRWADPRRWLDALAKPSSLSRRAAPWTIPHQEHFVAELRRYLANH